ncbi:hypothetical protein L596_022175 [Steinernema carpocapsae]|uniref:Uncharacterized protein n=1 Tax=Steinernema carpocapsae TaxID=34508 RepID=A0A4U5ML18_STECR|nr:hypothetical protein L596_022175 [Steinernema carpocapsae]
MNSLVCILILIVLAAVLPTCEAKPHINPAHYSKQSNENRSDSRNVSSNVSFEDEDSEERNHFRRILHDFRSVGLGLGFRARRAVRR